jgi:hypothetical protein
MSFDIKSFAAQVRPRPDRPNPQALANSVFDAGSPQYVRPEDLFLDVQSRLFGLRPVSAQDLQGLDPGDFKLRWLRDGASHATVQRIGSVSGAELAEATMSLLRSPRRRNERLPTLLPLIPEIGIYKNIKANLPNFLNDQFRPALSFADPDGFALRVQNLQRSLAVGAQSNDTIKTIARSLLVTPGPSKINPNFAISLHEGPLLRDYSVFPSRPFPVCESLRIAIETLIVMEASLPRVLWTRWLTTVLRIWLPMFYLRRCAVTAAAAKVAVATLGQDQVPTLAALTERLHSQNGVLRGSLEWLNQLAPVIQNYVRARFELTILLELANLTEWLKERNLDPQEQGNLAQVRAQLDQFEFDTSRAKNLAFPNSVAFSGVQLSMPGDTGSGKLAFDSWLKWIVDNRSAMDALARIIGADSTVDLMEKTYAQIRPDYEPLKAGFGKNAFEYVAFVLGAPRKADRDPEQPDEFSLFFRSEGGQRARQIQVHPGPQLLGLLTQLVEYEAKRKYGATAKLSDLLDLFEWIGIDFRSDPEDFGALKAELLRLGFLQSSADAAEAASLNPAYRL